MTEGPIHCYTHTPEVVTEFNHPELGQLTVSTGLTPEQAVQLIDFTNGDPEILFRTRDLLTVKKRDGEEAQIVHGRFANPQTLTAWLEKERQIYVFHDPHGKLKGIIWFGKSDIDSEVDFEAAGEQHTFAVRIYDDARGKGLYRQFSEAAIVHYRENHMAEGDILWLSTQATNERALRAYERTGWKQIGYTFRTGIDFHDGNQDFKKEAVIFMVYTNP